MSFFYDLDCVIEKLKCRQYPTEGEIHLIIANAIEILSTEPALKKVSSPVTICGDIRGQFYDFLEIFHVGGNVPDTNYLFLGNYIDTTYCSLETFLLIIALKARYPNRITLLRGYREMREQSIFYGFYDECQCKYKNSEVWKMCCDVFDYLPISAVINDKIFCVHSGLSPDITSIDQINLIDRKNMSTKSGVIYDFVSSHPNNFDDADEFCWFDKGNNYLFSKDAVAKFNKQNKIDLIVRSHDIIMEGYLYMFNDQLVTIFSAPNFRYHYKNNASILECDDNLSKKFHVFQSSPKSVKEIFSERTVPDFFISALSS